MDILKNILGIGNSIGGFFSKKKKDLEDAFQQFNQPSQRQQAPKLSFQRPTPTPAPKINVTPPKLSFQQPKPAVVPQSRQTVPTQPQTNPLLDFFKNTATKVAQGAGNTVKSLAKELPSTKFGTAVGKTIVRPLDAIQMNRATNADLEEARKMTDLAIKLSAQGKSQEAQKLFQRSRELSQGATKQAKDFGQGNKKLQEDVVKNGVGTILSLLGAGYTAKNLMIPAAGALIGGVSNKLQGKSFAEGAGKGIADSLPMSGVMQFTSPAMNAAAPQIAKYVSNPFFRAVAERGLVGAGNVLENRIINTTAGAKSDFSQDVFAFTLGALAHSPGQKINGWVDLPEATKTSIIRIANKAGLDTTPMSWAGDLKWQNTPKFLDDLRFSIKQNGLKKTAEQGLDTAAENINMGLSVKPIGGSGAIMDAETLKFSKPYKRGDIGALEKQLDTILGTDNYNFNGKFTGQMAGRETAMQGLEEAAKTSPEAKRALAQAKFLTKQLERARGIVKPAEIKTEGASPQMKLNEYAAPKKTAEQIQQEIQAGTYRPRTSLIPSPEKPVLTASDKEQLTKMGFTADDISSFEKDIAGGDKGALQSLKDFNDQMKEADQSLGLKTTDEAFQDSQKMADEALKTKYNLKTAEQLKAWKESQARKIGDANYRAGNEALKETYNLKTPEQMAVAQQKIADSVNQLEELNKASGLPPEGTPTAPAYSTKDATVFTKMKNLANAIVVESRAVLNGMGEAGQQAAKRIDNMYNGAERMTGGLVADYGKAIDKLEPAQIENVLKSLDGQAVTLTSQEQIAASNIRNILNGVAKQSGDAGVEIKLPDGTKVPFTPKENYIPHMVDEDKLKAFRDQTIKYMVDSKQIPDVTTASTFIDDMISGTPMAEAYQRAFGQKLPTRFGNIEMARIFDFPSEILRYDAKLLPDYLAGAASRIHQVLNFGPDNEIMTNLLNNMARSGYDAKTAEGILNTNLKLTQENPTLKQAVSSIKQVQATMKLGLGAITNAGQSVNTATKYGIVNTMKNMFKANTPESQEFALRTGSVVESALKEIEDEAKGGKGWLDKITAPGFGVVEKFNRVVAANAGKDYANSTFQQLLKNPTDSKAAEALSQMIEGFKPEEAIKRGSLTAEELLKAGQKAVNTTQFKTRPIDLPPTWSSSFGRLLTQFKSFSYKHAQFIANDVIKPALKGDVGPLTRYIALGLVVGEGIADVKAVVRRRDRPTNPAERAFDNLSTVGGVGLAQDAISAAQRGSEAVLSWIAGPTLSDAAKLAGGIGLAVQGKPKTLGRMLLGNIPIVGQPLANTVFPATGAYKARTPDLIQEAIGMVPDSTANAAEAAQGFSNVLDFNNMDEQKIKDQITSVQKQKKDIISQAGFLGIGQMSEEEKNTKLAALDAEEKTLKANLKLQGIQDYLGPNKAEGIDKYKYQSEQQKWARTVYESGLPEEKKMAIFKQMGINPEDAKYDSYANMPDETKSKFLIENLSVIQDHQEVLDFLVSARKESISGKIFVSNANLQDLEDEGIISDSERKQLAKLKIKTDKDGNVIKSQTGSGTGGLTKSKLQTMINKAKAYDKQFDIGKPPEIDTTIESKGSTTKPVKVPKMELSADFFTSSAKVPKAPTLEEIFQKTKVKIPTTNIAKARALIDRARSGGQGNTKIKLSQSFFRGNRKA